MLPALPHNPPGRPTMVTSAMKSAAAARTGTRKGVFGVRPNEKYYDEKREIGLKKMTQFPFQGAEKYTGEWYKNTNE